MTTPTLNFNELTDSDLRERAASGCRDALHELLQRHVVTAVRSAHAILGNRDDALDVTQETLLKLAAEIGSPWRGGSVQAWVAVVAQRLALNRRKGEQMRKRREEQAWREADTFAAEPQAAVELSESLDALRAELATLGAVSAEIVLLYYIQHLPLAEISKQTGLSVDACKQRLSRSRDELGERLRKRGILLASLALLASLSAAADSCAAEAAPHTAALAARVSRSSHAPNAAVQTHSHLTYPVILATLLVFGLGSLLAREVCARANWQSGRTLVIPTSNATAQTDGPRGLKQTQENSMLKSKLDSHLCAAALALAAGCVAQAEETPHPVPSASPPAQTAANREVSASLQPLQTADGNNAFFSVMAGPPSSEVHINVDDIAQALKNLPEAAIAQIPGDDLTAKAKHLLENPSIPKTVVTAPIMVQYQFKTTTVLPDDALPGTPAEPQMAAASKQAPPRLLTPLAAPTGAPAKYQLWATDSSKKVPLRSTGLFTRTPGVFIGNEALAAAFRKTPEVAVNLSSAEKPQVESIQMNALPQLPNMTMPALPANTVFASASSVSYSGEVPPPLVALVRPLIDHFLGANHGETKHTFEAPTRVEGKDYIFDANKNDDAKAAPAAAAAAAAPETPPAPPESIAPETKQDF